MILFPYLRTRRVAVQLLELSLGNAIALCKLPPDRHEAVTTEFLKMVARNIEKPTERHITDPRMMTVQERTLLVCHYLSQVSDEGADFAVGSDGKLSDYVVFDADLENEFVDLGEVGGKAIRLRPLLGVHVEMLERMCTSRGDWLTGLLACQLEEVGATQPDFANLTDPQLLEWVKSRFDAVHALPESEFEALYLAYSSGVSKLHHFFSPAVDDGGLVYEVQNTEAGQQYPARFRAISCISKTTQRIFG
jgi:hypothetical protein